MLPNVAPMAYNLQASSLSMLVKEAHVPMSTHLTSFRGEFVNLSGCFSFVTCIVSKSCHWRWSELFNWEYSKFPKPRSKEGFVIRSKFVGVSRKSKATIQKYYTLKWGSKLKPHRSWHLPGLMDLNLVLYMISFANVILQLLIVIAVWLNLMSQRTQRG